MRSIAELKSSVVPPAHFNGLDRKVGPLRKLRGDQLPDERHVDIHVIVLTPVVTKTPVSRKARAGQASTLAPDLVSWRSGRLGGGDPDAEKDCNEPDDQVQRDGFVDELRGKQRRRQWIYGHRIGHARRRRPLQRQHPENEGERSAANPEIGRSDPLWRAKAAQDRGPTGGDA